MTGGRFTVVLSTFIAAVLTLTICGATPASAKVRQPFRAIYKAQLPVLRERQTALKGVEGDATQGVAERLATCGTAPPDPAGLAMIADATRASADAWRTTAIGVADNVQGMVSKDWFNGNGDMAKVNRAAHGFRQFGQRGREAVYVLASAFEALGAGDCATAGRLYESAQGDQTDANDIYKASMATFRSLL